MASSIQKNAPQRYVDSYYSRSISDNASFPALEQDISASVCIIGGGMAGVATAHGLVDRGVRPVLLEATRIGFGASGRNGGFVSPGYSANINSIIAKVGKDGTRELLTLTRDAMDIIKRRIGNHKDRLCGGTEGLLNVSWFNQPGQVQRNLDLMNDLMGVEYEYWSREKIRNLYLTDRYYDGYMKPDGFQLHSLNYTRLSARQTEKGGAGIYENSAALKLQHSRNGWKVTSQNGSVTADNIVVCCSGYIGNLVPRLSRSTLSVATYILMTEPLGNRLQTAIRGPYGVSDNRFSSNYYRTLGDGRLFWGGRVSMFNPVGNRLKNIMMKDLLHVYPQLRGIKADVAWGGLMGYATHKMPQIGQLEPGFWYCQGFGGSGMTTTIAGGEVVSAAIANNEEQYQLFSPFGLNYAGKPFGPAIAQSAYWLFQLQDKLKAWRLNK